MSETENARFYFATCPKDGIEIKLKFGGDPRDAVSKLPVALTEESTPVAPKCFCGERHLMVEITAACAAWLEVDADERDYVRPGVCRNGHAFEPGVDLDMEAEGREPSPDWCNVCGEGRKPAEVSA